MRNPYAIPNAHEPLAVVTFQSERKLREVLPVAWDEYRKALLDSGLVEERRQMRAANGE